jgi:hypothetical protein
MRRRSGGYAGIAQLVEHQPSKLRVAGSSPVSRSNVLIGTCMGARVAQQVEHLHGKQKVIGSNPIVGSKAREERY